MLKPWSIRNNRPHRFRSDLNSLPVWYGRITPSDANYLKPFPLLDYERFEKVGHFGIYVVDPTGNFVPVVLVSGAILSSAVS